MSLTGSLFRVAVRGGVAPVRAGGTVVGATLALERRVRVELLSVGGKVSLRLTRGDLVLIETCGGGGFGPPAERSVEAREHDRREGYV